MGKLKFILPALLTGCILSPSLGLCQNAAAPQPAPKAQAEPIPTKPLRYEGDRAENFVRAMLPTLAITQRTTDPFGMFQDPQKEAVNTTNPQAAPLPAVVFQEVIDRIQITTVMAGERKFLVGSRSISQGDRFPINYDNQPIWVEVIEVSSRQVAFKNTATGEIAAQRQNSLPPGMTPGNNQIPAPGMTPSGPQAPLDLTVPASNDPSQSR